MTVLSRDGWRFARWTDGSLDVTAPRTHEPGVPAIRLSSDEVRELERGIAPASEQEAGGVAVDARRFLAPDFAQLPTIDWRDAVYVDERGLWLEVSCEVEERRYSQRTRPIATGALEPLPRLLEAMDALEDMRDSIRASLLRDLGLDPAPTSARREDAK